MRPIAVGEHVVKYGQVIALATASIPAGAHVHVHNVRNLAPGEAVPFTATKTAGPVGGESLPDTFQGYLREDGAAGTRNYVAVVATVNCSATVVKGVCRRFEGHIGRPDIDGVVPITHAHGCAQTIGGEGHATLNRTIAGWMLNPNVVGCVVIGLGCEGTTLATLRAYLGDFQKPLYHFDIQKVGGTAEAIREGEALVRRLLTELPHFERRPLPVSQLKLALNCGGSDGFSSLTANPALGVAADLLVDRGASVVLAEIPECQGADDLLRARARTPDVVKKIDEVFDWWKAHAEVHQMDLNSNLSPGNIAGGISTIIEKSLGAMSKAGGSALVDVVGYSLPVTRSGFNLMNTPGYDPVSVTGLIAGGCQVVTFTTGRGSVYGSSIAPTIKVATNSELARRMAGDMDFNAGRAVEGATLAEVGRDLYRQIVSVASGERTKSETLGMGWEEFTPWPVGETL
jgi:altronate dehydratase